MVGIGRLRVQTGIRGFLELVDIGDGRVVTRVVQQRIVGAQIGVQDEAEGIDRRNGWVEQVVMAGQVVGVENLIAIVAAPTVVALDNDNRWNRLLWQCSFKALA